MFRQCVRVVMLLAGLQWAAWARADTMLMDAFIVTPLPGQRAPLEQAIHDHLNFRLSKGESRSWLLYAPTLGDNIGRLMLFHCCVTWEELERYHVWEDSEEVMTHWMNFVEPFVQEMGHYISEVDANNSNWEGVEGVSPYLNVTELHFRAGHWEQARKDVGTLSGYAKAMDWQPRWLWAWQLGGDPILNLIVPQERLSDMSMQTAGFEQLLSEHLGDRDKAKALLASWNEHFVSSNIQLFKLLRAVDSDPVGK